jgi:hypothetical protein
MIENTLVAARLPIPLLNRMKDYCRENDLSQSQVIRRGVSAILNGNPNEVPSPPPKTGWSVRRR